jgi:uncharacterized membrane protein YqaE (UPF0057 family)
MKQIFLKILVAFFAASMVLSPAEAASIIPSSTVNSSDKPDPGIMSAFRSAMNEFKSLSKKERKARIKEVKKELKEYKKEKRAGQEPSTDKTLLIILAILLPPLAVYLHEGAINNKFWISLLLTLLFWLPGVIYALVVILDKDN